jgi:Fic family protein
LSTLTKVLIVLLSLFSFFLCGTIVTYVGNATNYKKLYDIEKDAKDVALAEKASALRQYSEQVEAVKKIKEDLSAQIQLLEDEKSRLDADLRSAQRESLKYQARADSSTAILAGFEQTIANLEQSLKTTQDQLDKVRREDIQEQKEFNELTARLYETIVQLEALRADKRRLLEEKAAMEELFRTKAGGTAAAKANIVTPKPSTATPVEAMPAPGDLKGLVTEVSESLVAISIGSADGVGKGMVFHVTRGDEFVCNVVITDVDTNKAAGVLELKLQQPRIGDTVSTRL